MQTRTSLVRRSLLASLMPDVFLRLVRAGTHLYPPSERDELVVTNIMGYLAAVSSLAYAVNYASMSATGLEPLIWGNLAAAVLTGIVPLFHRVSRIAGALVLAGTLYTTIFCFTYLLGRDSGVQLNYIGAAAVGFLILGLTKLWLVALLVLVACALHVYAWFHFTAPQPGIVVPAGFFSQTYAMSAVSIMAIIFVAVFYAFTLVRDARRKSEILLLNVLPQPIADRLKSKPEDTIAERHEDATVLFADICGFTVLSSRIGPERVVALMDDLFTACDRRASELNVEKIKTIGDAYMAVAGLPHPLPGHADAAADLALAIRAATKSVCARHGLDLDVRIGIASGPVMAGVIGRTKFAYDVWGETVNRAARLESSGRPGLVLVSEGTRSRLSDRFTTSPHDTLDLKGLGPTRTWTLDHDQ